MHSINKLQAALASVTNEVTVAAAQINFDFSLVKTEAPKEYHSVGQCLSEKRKDEAENGQIHITARRLGALFEGMSPPTPHLMKAYGTRVSEISRVVKSQTPSGGESGVFGQYVGADGTSIWAAATSVTSSTSAIQVQLLACMLARLFDAPEAISIWVEIVKGRRSEIALAFEQNGELPFTVLTAASQAEISRAQLAEWDASARAWLRTADSIKSTEQKKLMLILDNLGGLSVNEDVQVYASVVSTWRSSLATMEKLIQGIPQAIHTGEAILGLASWHLYPDMVVLESSKPDLRMNDEIVTPGGVLTVGLQSPATQSGQAVPKPGICWSLSLAHLRYYGHPVLTTRQLSSNTSRVDFGQFSEAVFGCLLGVWNVPRAEVHLAADIVSAIAGVLEDGVVSEHERVESVALWFDMLATASKNYQAAKGQEKQQIMRLFQLGQRRAGTFLSSAGEKENEVDYDDFQKWKVEEDDNSAYFGLRNPAKFLRCFNSDEDRLRYLRRFAFSTGAGISDVIIRYRWKGGYAFATAIPNQNPFLPYQRWFPVDPDIPKEIRYHNFRESTETQVPGTSEKSKSKMSQLPTSQHSNHSMELNWDVHVNEVIPDIPGESCYAQGDDQFKNDLHFFLEHQFNRRYKRYNFLYGDPDSAALYVDEEYEYSENAAMQQVSLDDMLWCLKGGMVCPRGSPATLLEAIRAATTDYLHVLSAVSLVYAGLLGATIDISVLGAPILATQWASQFLQTEPADDACNRETALACIVYFETGNSDVSPEQLHDVFAMSSGNSIYISEQLLCDPWDLAPGFKFKRVLGNFGRSGVTMLIPPPNPMVRKADPGAWKVINHAVFNGLEEDHFPTTSLHLSFTEYYRSVDLSLRGEQDVRVAVLESVVSVHDAGKWVADVDILAAMQSPQMGRISPRRPRCKENHTEEAIISGGAVSLESWDEILDLPAGTSVVRAKGNPLARLSVSAVLSQLQKSKKLSHKIQICPPGSHICISCYLKTYWEAKDVILVY